MINLGLKESSEISVMMAPVALIVPESVLPVQTPVAVTNVPADMLQPEQQWSDKAAFTKSLNHLGDLYTANFKKYASGGGFVSESVAAAITAAGPKM